MPRIRREFSKVDGRSTFKSYAYTDDGKVWKWESNDRPCPLDACREYGIPVDVNAQRRAERVHIDAAMAAYRASQPAVPSEEEQYEMRAAFGAGKEVVDVVTGRKWKT
jgi:hypothetical protein